MNEENAPPEIPPDERQKSSGCGMLIGLLPSVMLLGVFAIDSTGGLSKSSSTGLLWLVCALSVGCCFIASIMIFESKAAKAAIGGSILFLLLNASIAFFSGCTAVLSGAL